MTKLYAVVRLRGLRSREDLGTDKRVENPRLNSVAATRQRTITARTESIPQK